MDPNQQGQSNAGAPSAPNSGANAPATGASTPSAGTPAAGTPPPVFSGAGASTQAPTAGAPTSGVPVTPGPTAPATPTATPAGSSARRFFGASNRPGSAASAGQPASGIYSGNPTPGIITSAPAASGAAGGKKLSKGMIVGLIVIAILAIAAVVVGIVASNSSSNKSGDSSNSASAPINMSELKTAYNNLANYIAFGDENTSEIKNNSETYTQHDMLEMALSNGFYPYPILDADAKLDEASSGAKKAYFSGLEQFYSQLPEGLTEGYGINVSDIYDYYHGFSNINMVSLDQIVSRYKTEGLEPTRNYLNNYVVSNSDKKDIRSYTDYLREYYIAFLNLVNDVKINRGCEINPENINSCDITSVASYGDYEESQKIMETGAAYRIKATRQSASTKTLLEIYDLVNDESGGNL